MKSRFWFVQLVQNVSLLFQSSSFCIFVSKQETVHNLHHLVSRRRIWCISLIFQLQLSHSVQCWKMLDIKPNKNSKWKLKTKNIQCICTLDMHPTMCKEGKPEFEFSAAEDMSAISSQKRLLILGKEWIPWQQYTKVFSKTWF